MNFFKSVFSDDPDPPNPGSVSRESDNASQTRDEDDPDHRHYSPNDDQSGQNPNSDADVSSSFTGGGWSFGGFIQTLTSRSESVLEIYRRDLQEFGSGLRKELEVAQGSLETAGHTIDEFRSSVLKETAQMISQGKDAILAADIASDSDSHNLTSSRLSLSSQRYNRFDAQVRLIQMDVSTYSLEPEDLNDYSKWKSEFSLDEKREEIKAFFHGDESMSNVFKELVPKSIDSETFWSRYYYKVFKLKQAEDLRAKLVSAISKEEEELSWDVDDDDDENAGRQSSNLEKVDNTGGGSRSDESQNLSESKVPDNKSLVSSKDENIVEESKDGISVVDDKGEKTANTDDGSKGGLTEAIGNKGSMFCSSTGLSKNGAKSEFENRVTPERKDEVGGSETQDKDSSKASSQSLMQQEEEEEEDLGWDEIEDLSSIDEIKLSQRKSSNKADLRKRLSAAEEEGLSWDIEDEEEPARS